ncbi:MAG: hypothetical protein U5R06_12590 [candidate division KSB1 bacterium]|nr:hypothetical protein [candidate division KSB1 bacterium]
MTRHSRNTLWAGILGGSLWAFSEVVLGAALRATALPLRSTILTGIATFILFAAFAYTRRIPTLILAMLTAVSGRIVLTLAAGAQISLTNGSLAVIVTGLCFAGALYMLQAHKHPSFAYLGFTAATAILLSGTLFYAAGLHMDPCPYLTQMTPFMFFMRESLPWAVLSAVSAPLGYAAGHALLNAQQRNNLKRLTIWGLTAGCWLCCALVIWVAG